MVRTFMTTCMVALLALLGSMPLSSSASLATSTVTAQTACDNAAPGQAHCNAIFLRHVSAPTPDKIYGYHAVHSYKAMQKANAYPPGVLPPYGPVNLDIAYNLPQVSSNPQTIAVVTAYDDPNAESDLAYYRTIFGLGACTTANGCFRKVNQSGAAGPYPAASAVWAQETSLDLDMVSAICRNCSLILVEATSTNMLDLGAGVNTAVSLGATVVSNSYGSSSEFSQESYVCNQYYTHYGVAITASTGDSGLGLQVPAACSYVVAVGGTKLQTNGTETAWSGSGGGCSIYIARPSWQNYVNSGCPYSRAVADVSADADPYTGVYAYDTYMLGGWYQAGGTSASAPIIAGIYGLAGNAKGLNIPSQYLWIYRYANAGCLNYIPTNSTTPYSFQPGLGTPNTISCF